MLLFFSEGAGMKFYKKIEVNLLLGRLFRFYLLGLPLFQVEVRTDGKMNFSLPLFQKKSIDKSKPVFYLKINRDEEYTFLCLQHWINTLNALGNDFIIICDKPELELKVLRRIRFASSNIKFINSCKNSFLKSFVKIVATKWWKKATFAHLTTFYHAQKHSITKFWNIDADDTMFALEPEEIATMLRRVEDYANSVNIKTISLDMWRSRTDKNHWSFGITYVNNFKEIFDTLKNIKTADWQKNYTHLALAFNLDWFFTYLKDNNLFKIETFYFENTSFIHWGSFLINTIESNICTWKGNKLSYPVLLNIYNDKTHGQIPIADDCIKFELDNGVESNFYKFAYKYIYPANNVQLHISNAK